MGMAVKWNPWKVGFLLAFFMLTTLSVTDTSNLFCVHQSFAEFSILKLKYLRFSVQSLHIGKYSSPLANAFELSS